MINNKISIGNEGVQKRQVCVYLEMDIINEAKKRNLAISPLINIFLRDKLFGYLKDQHSNTNELIQIKTKIQELSNKEKEIIEKEEEERFNAELELLKANEANYERITKVRDILRELIKREPTEQEIDGWLNNTKYGNIVSYVDNEIVTLKEGIQT